MNIILAIQLFFSTLQAPILSKHQILIYGQDFPMLFLLSYTDEQATMTLHTLPVETLYYDQETKQMQSLQNLQEKKEEDRLIQLLTSYYSFTIENTIYVDIEEIEKHFDIMQPMHTITSFYDMQRYFSYISAQISFGDIWHIFDFVTSDLSFSEIYTLYRLYRSDDFTLCYSFPFLIHSQEYWIALSKNFYSVT